MKHHHTMLNVSHNHKTVKGDKKGVYLTGILYLAPGDTSGYEVCKYRTPGCSKACLFTAGRGQMNVVQQARIRKTKMFFQNRDKFWIEVIEDIQLLIRRAKRKGMLPCVRLNGTSDLPWERIPVMIEGRIKAHNIMSLFPDVMFYDYTKDPTRKDLPKNYKLTFSLAEDNDVIARKQFRNGHNVAVVFRQIPPIFWGKRVVDGDADDLRFLDPENVVVALSPKGQAKKDRSGFVR